MCRAAYASCISSCKSALHAETMAVPRVDVSAVATSDGSLEFRTELSGGSRFLGGGGGRNWRERGATWTRWLRGSPPHVGGREDTWQFGTCGCNGATPRTSRRQPEWDGWPIQKCVDKRCPMRQAHTDCLFQIQMNQAKRELNSLRNLRLRRPSSDTMVYLLDIHWMSDSTCVLVNSGCTCIHSRRFSSAT